MRCAQHPAGHQYFHGAFIGGEPWLWKRSLVSLVERGKGPWPANNDLPNVQAWVLERLGGSPEDREMRSVSRILLDSISGLDRGQRIVNDWKANESALDTLALWCDRFKNGEPLQYILEESNFYGLTLKMDARALIPRPETEELIRHLLQRQEGVDPKRIVDIGTGSGCMALAWKSQRPQDEVTGVDVSEAALSLARENAKQLGFEDVHWEVLDVLESSPFKMTSMAKRAWDVVMSNPPYIPESERSSMENRVVEFEPANALFVSDQDPLCFYRAIATGCLEGAWLVSGGWLGLECHRDYCAAVAAWLSEQSEWESIHLLDDLQGAPRMVLAQRK